MWSFGGNQTQKCQKKLPITIKKFNARTREFVTLMYVN